jgi:hypothetical protein
VRTAVDRDYLHGKLWYNAEGLPASALAPCEVECAPA